MDSSQFTLLLVVCFAAHAIRTVYEILKHKKIVRASKITFAIIFPVMAILWASWIGACQTDPLNVGIPAGFRYAGLVVSIAGLAIFLTALFTIKSLESYTGDLITTGIYSHIRHPMYLAFILWIFGMPLLWGGGMTMGVTGVMLVNVLMWRYFEERELEQRFPDYAAYRRKTIF